VADATSGFPPLLPVPSECCRDRFPAKSAMQQQQLGVLLRLKLGKKKMSKLQQQTPVSS